MKKFTTQMVVFGLICLTTAISPVLAERDKGTSAEPTTRPASGSGRRIERDNFVVKVYRLKYANANYTAHIIRQAGLKCNAVSLDDKNSVVISATMSGFAEIEKLLEQLDSPPIPKAPRDIEIIHMNRSRLGRVAETLHSIAPDIKFTEDHNIGALLMDKTDYKSNMTLVDNLMHESNQAEHDSKLMAAKNYIIRVVWLISENGAALAEVPADMQDVVDELTPMGIGNLQLAAQSMAQIESIGKFTLTSTPGVFANCALKIAGEISEELGCSPHLNVELEATGAALPKQSKETSHLVPMPSSASNQLASFRTNMSAPPGQKIVLGVATTLGYQSVFVIQILEKTPAKATDKVKPAPVKTK